MKILCIFKSVTSARSFVLDLVVENSCSATFAMPLKCAGEYGGGVNDDGDDKGERPASNHRSFDYPVGTYNAV